ncbi:hypothetical protein TNCV_876671, partial [Trichonephila clavipes]
VSHLYISERRLDDLSKGLWGRHSIRST